MVQAIATLPKVKPYEAFLLDFLQDPEEAANYLTGTLENFEGDRELLAGVLWDAINHLVAARRQAGQLSPAAESAWAAFGAIVEVSGVEVIFSLVALLAALGLRLTITTAASEAVQKSHHPQTLSTPPATDTATDRSPQ